MRKFHFSTTHYLLLAAAAMQASALYCFWQALQAVIHVNRFWGIVEYGWVPAASLALSVFASFATFVSWTTLAGRNRKHQLFVQLNLQLLYAAAIILAMVCRTYPSRVDEEVGPYALVLVASPCLSQGRSCSMY
jgi:hypothetical protein